MKVLTSSLALCAVLTASGAAQAALLDRGGGLIYDTDLNVTWLQDANYAITTGYNQPQDVPMTWSKSMIWASNLSYYDSVRKVTYTDWRLPNTDESCSGFNCRSSELGHMFYSELGGVAEQSIATTHNANYDLFQNIQLASYLPNKVLSSVPYATLGFNFSYGYLDINYGSGYAWAVRDGDVAAVPVPAAAWLMGSGILGLVGVARRKKTQ